MIKKFTSALANKTIKQLNEEKSILLNKEQRNCVYKAYKDEEPTIPEYDYSMTRARVQLIDEQVRKIKHALNIFNCETVLPELNVTIDEALVLMAQLEQSKNTLSTLKDRDSISRVESFRNTNAVPEFVYTNYDVKVAAGDYEEISKKIIDIQLALDTVNQTVTFEVDV